jgi:hypothetical protein
MTLKNFQKGKYDVLIVKNRGAFGFNAPRLKVILDLSPRRTIGDTIQRINRANRPFEGILVAHLVQPADVLADDIYDAFIAREQIEALRRSSGDLVDSTEIARKPGSMPKLVRIKNAVIDVVGDTKLQTVGGAWLKLALYVLEEYPMLIHHLTIPDIAHRAIKLGLRVDALPEDFIQNIGEHLEVLREACVENITALTRVTFIKKHGHPYRSGDKTDSARFGPIIGGLWKEAYGRAETPKVENIVDPDDMQRLVTVIEDMIDEWNRGQR